MLYKRSPHLVVYWLDGHFVLHNYCSGVKITGDPLLCSLIDFCGQWRSVRDVAVKLGGYSRASVLETLEKLRRSGMLEGSTDKATPRKRAMQNWDSWNPAAGFFHFSTKDTEFAEDPEQAIRALKGKADSVARPSSVKRYRAAAPIKLQTPEVASEFSEVLLKRRTWRKFADKPVSLDSLARVLRLTFGIQGWVHLPRLGKFAMKTSPSGGALHPIEAYVLVQRVAGLKRGLYHYNAEDHSLEWIRGPLGRASLVKSLGNQWWCAGGGFLVVMTAVFARSQWKYDFARSYRVVLADAGHLCQTFCLTATWLGLAPFCTMAFADSTWEKWLGIDGVGESVLYVAGAGMLPSGAPRKGANITEL